MKKDFIFAPIMLAVGVLLGLLSKTGLGAHIAISVLGLLVLAVYTALTRRSWKSPLLEILMRAFYGIALITGIVIRVNYISALAVAHKIFGILFLVALVAVFVFNCIKKK